MEFFEALFHDAPEEWYVEVAYGKPPTDRRWTHVQRFHEQGPAEGYDGHCYFAPALRSDKGSEKSDVAATRVFWVDVDNEAFPRATLPPSFVVFSGHGWHLYWLLKDWVSDRDVIEKCNKILLGDVDGDAACWNVNRLLRVPGTPNEDSRCELRQNHSDIAYDPSDIMVLSRLDRKTRHKIRTGDRRGYPSRSERDWAVVQNLVRAQATDELIRLIFEHQPVGDKVRDVTTNEKYLTRTIERARGHQAIQDRGGIETRGDGYYIVSGKRTRRISTFTVTPKLLLEGHPFGAEDAIVGTVKAAGFSWERVTFTRTAFTSVRAMDRATPIAAWQWLGRDEDVRILLPFLMEQLREKGLPRTSATNVLGLHKLKDGHVFVGVDGTLGAEDAWGKQDAPLVYLETRREHPDVHIYDVDDPPEELLESIRTLLPKLNEPSTIWPIIGWYFATPFKPALEAIGYRFPILNIHGTRGSGKTTTIQRVMMPLLGQKDPKSYDANTTRFVILSLLGSNNAVPVAFSEFRFGSADKFLRYVLLSYDTGHDPRGRADQTTVDYPLSAPFSVDGEDLIADPAAKERIVAVTMHPAAIDEGTEAFNVFQQFRRRNLTPFGSYYLRRVLRTLLDSDLAQILSARRNDLHDAFPQRLPDRVRSNYTTIWFGITQFAEAAGLEPPKLAEVLAPALRTVFDPDRGRAPVLADEMVEDLINAAAANVHGFNWDYDNNNNTLWFQLGSAYPWWLALRKRTDRGTLGRDAIRNQLKESEYVIGPETRGSAIMYGANLDGARELGLDVPDKIIREVEWNV